MPTYEYECPSCHNKEDIILPYGDKSGMIVTCETCDVLMVRCLSLPAVVFNGDGWAKKDRRGGQG